MIKLQVPRSKHQKSSEDQATNTREAPSDKIQTRKKRQAPNHKHRSAASWCLVFWDFSGACFLELGVSAAWAGRACFDFILRTKVVHQGHPATCAGGNPWVVLGHPHR